MSTSAWQRSGAHEILAAQFGPGQGHLRREAGRGGADFVARTIKSARSCALLTRGKIGGTAILGPARSARYDGRSEERERDWRSVCRARENPPGLLRAGRCRRRRSVAVRPAGARPDQAEGLAAFVIEQVGVDRRGEAWIVELDREVIAALVGALRPRGADLRAADKHPVARCVVAGRPGLRNDTTAFRLDAQGDDLARDFDFP